MSAVSTTNEQAIGRVRAWIERFVVDLNLCPFARSVASSNALRIVACESASPEAIATLLISIWASAPLGLLMADGLRRIWDARVADAHNSLNASARA